MPCLAWVARCSENISPPKISHRQKSPKIWQRQKDPHNNWSGQRWKYFLVFITSSWLSQNIPNWIYCNCHMHRQFVEAVSCLGLSVDILTVGWIVKLVHSLLRQIFLHSIGFLLAPHIYLSLQSPSKSKEKCFALFGNVIKQDLWFYQELANWKMFRVSFYFNFYSVLKLWKASWKHTKQKCC